MKIKLMLPVLTGPNQNSVCHLISPLDFVFRERYFRGSRHQNISLSENWLATFTVSGTRMIEDGCWEIKVGLDSLLISSLRFSNIRVSNWINRRVIEKMKSDLLANRWVMDDHVPHPESDFAPHSRQCCPGD